MTIELGCHHIWKIFGPTPDYIKETINPTLSKAELLAQTGHVVAVRDVSFEVNTGETFVVMGLSGSGKSTLVRCLSRLIEPTAGEILLRGENLLAMDEKELRQVRRHTISMVFQHFGLFPHRRIIDNVSYGLEVQGVDKATRYQRAHEVLELVSLLGWENHYPGELSGGMQQRVGIARALAVDPQLLLFDEPFSALDPLIRREMQDELIKLQRVMHKTIVFITHDFLEAIKLGDRIAIMKDGTVVQIGTPEDVVAHPANDYVREFTKDVPRLKVITAKSMMQRWPIVVPQTEQAQQVAYLMQRKDCWTAFVVGEQQQFVGMLYRPDVEATRPETYVDTILATNQLRATPDTTLEKLLPLIMSTDMPIPIVDANQRFLGAVDRNAIMLALNSDS